MKMVNDNMEVDLVQWKKFVDPSGDQSIKREEAESCYRKDKHIDNFLVCLHIDRNKFRKF